MSKTGLLAALGLAFCTWASSAELKRIETTSLAAPNSAGRQNQPASGPSAPGSGVGSEHYQPSDPTAISPKPPAVEGERAASAAAPVEPRLVESSEPGAVSGAPDIAALQTRDIAAQKPQAAGGLDEALFDGDRPAAQAADEPDSPPLAILPRERRDEQSGQAVEEHILREMRFVGEPEIKVLGRFTTGGRDFTVMGARQGEGGPLWFARVGPLVFFDNFHYERVSLSLRRRIEPHVLRVNDLADSILAGGMGAFTAATALALLDVDFLHDRAIDIGAGDGTLSLVAAKLGAALVEVVEIEEESLAKAGKNLALNGLKRDRHFRLIQADLADTEGLARRLGPAAGPSVMISNIGNWAANYSVNNADSMALMSRLGGVGLFIAGGYNEGRLKTQDKLEEDIRLLELLGFQAMTERSVDFRFDANIIRTFPAARAEGVPVKLEEFRSALAERRSEHAASRRKYLTLKEELGQ